MPTLHKSHQIQFNTPTDLSDSEEVFYCPVYRQFLLLSQVWTCQYTGQQGLTYLQAKKSETRAYKLVQELPEVLVVAILAVVNSSLRLSIKQIVMEISELFRSRFLLGENVNVFENGKYYSGEIVHVHHPRIPDGNILSYINSNYSKITPIHECNQTETPQEIQVKTENGSEEAQIQSILNEQSDLLVSALDNPELFPDPNEYEYDVRLEEEISKNTLTTGRHVTRCQVSKLSRMKGITHACA